MKEYQSIFYEIINGFSPIFFNKTQVFIRHPTHIQNSFFEFKYNEFLNRFLEEGILSEEKKEILIFKEGLWTDQEEIEFISNKKAIEDLRGKISKEFLFSRKQILKNNLETLQKTTTNLFERKDMLIGFTAEKLAQQKVNFLKMIDSLYLDSHFSKKFFYEDSDFPDDIYDKLSNLYYESLFKFSQTNLKKLSVAPIFTNVFYLCDNNPQVLYGKPVIELTLYQLELFIYGRYFKQVLSERSDIPSDLMGNPDELMDVIELRQNAEKAGILGKDIDAIGSSSIPGASAQDLKKLGIETNQLFNLGDELKKSGGKLDQEALYRLYGGRK